MHTVIVKDYYDRLAASADIGKALIGKAAGQRAITYNGTYTVVFTLYGSRTSHAKSDRDRI